jgi:hypothetical protein
VHFQQEDVKNIIIENLFFKLGIEVIIEIEAMFRYIKTATIKIVRDIKNV